MQLALAERSHPPPTRYMAAMTVSPERAAQKLRGKALRTIRERRGLYQSAVAEGLGMTTQAWQKYEAGERRFDAGRLATVLQVLGVSMSDLEIEEARTIAAPRFLDISATDRLDAYVIDVYPAARSIEGAVSQGGEVNTSVIDPARTLDIRSLVGGGISAIEVAGELMSPWAEPGEIVLFDRRRYPRRGSGCVIETKAGRLLLAIYDKSDGSSVFFKTLCPEERTHSLLLVDLKGIYAVRLRGD